MVLSERGYLRGQFYLSMGLAGISSIVMTICLRLADYSNPILYLGVIGVVICVPLTIRDGRRFYSQLSKIETCRHIDSWKHESGNRVCSDCGEIIK